LGFLIALYGAFAIARAADFAPFVLRDGLILLALGALLFAAGAPRLFAVARPLPVPRWPNLGKLLFWVGLVCIAAASVALLGLRAQGLFGLFGTSLWALGAVLMLVGLGWPSSSTTEAYRPPAYRWGLDAAGRFVRLALGTQTGSAQEELRAQQTVWTLLLLLLAVAAALALRLWRLADYPPDCTGVECEWALYLTDMTMTPTTPGSPLGPGSYALLARLLFQLSGDGVWSLRLASALIGVLTLPALYAAARALARPPGAWLATLLLALSPWHIAAGRAADPSIVAPLWSCLAYFAAARAFQSYDRRWWVAAGIALGLLYVEVPALRAAYIVWLLMFVIAGASALRDEAALRVEPAVSPLLALLPVVGAWVVILPVVATGTRGFPIGALWLLPQVAAGQQFGWAALATALLRAGGATASGIVLEGSLLGMATAALAAVGVGALARRLVEPRAALAVAGLVIVGGAAMRVDAATALPSSLLLALLPFLFLSAAVAADALLWQFQQTWQPVLPPSPAWAAALALLLLFAGREAWQFRQDLGAASAAQTTAEAAIGRYLARCLDGAGPCASADGGSPLIFVPPAVLDNPTTRLVAGNRLDPARVRRLDPVRDIPPAELPQTGDPLIFLIPLENQALLQLLAQSFPTGRVQAEPENQAGSTLFAVYQLRRADLLARQGLQGNYFAGVSFGDSSPPEKAERSGPLIFDWQDEPPLPAPFSVEWEGSLVAPAAGPYRFAVTLPASSDPAQPIFNLQLDGRLVLDTSLGLTEQVETLAQGTYHLTMRYRSEEAPGDWSVVWTRPGGEPEPIPRELLYSPPFPNAGLLGTYFAGTRLQGPAITLRKDLVLGAPVDVPMPYSVRWQGKLAAPRAGEYQFALTANGLSQLLLDGQLVLNYAPELSATTDDPYTQAGVYLTPGWHTIELTYIPDGRQPDVRLLWQPPGSAPALLYSRYLTPILADISAADAPLPPAPELIDARLGNDDFALSYINDYYQPQTVYPPANLPPLLVEQVWQVGTPSVCASGDDQLNTPHGVAIDGAARRVYVADTGNHRIAVYPLDGGAAEYIASDLFQELADLDVAGGVLYALDAVAQPIFRIDVDSGEITPLSLDASFYRPRGLAVDPSGILWVADTGGARAVMIEMMPGSTAQGQVLTQIGGPETRFGKGQPVDVMVANGIPWAVTAEDGRLWRLDSLGSMAAIERSNTVDGPHLAALPDGTFFLTDPARHTLSYHAASGQPLSQFAYSGVLVNPVGVGAAVVDGLIYLAVSDSAACTLSLWRMAQ
jgi:sugar lactone lactonase YvrE